MENEELNLDNLFAEEVETIDAPANTKNKFLKESESAKAEKKKIKKKDSLSYKLKNIALKSVLPAVLTGAVFLIVGVAIASPKDEVTERVRQAKTIKSSSTVLENLNTLKDSQIDSLKRQLAEMTTYDKTGKQVLTDNGTDLNNLAFTKDVNAMARANLDEFLTKLVAISPTASDKEIQVLQQDMKQYMTPEASASNLYSTLTGGSAAKELGKKTTKISSPTVTLAKSTNKDSRTYFVITPISTPSDEKLYNAFYVVETTADWKLKSVRYAGYATDEFTKVAHELYDVVKDPVTTTDNQQTVTSEQTSPQVSEDAAK